jgi:hypothetical protein
MPGGFLQLLTTGKESEYLNYTPNISFFKSYFRRHTNFFINNLEVFGNFYEKSEVNTFLIPKSGDLLSKGFLKFNFDENYIEILGNYDNMVSTLTSDITLFFDDEGEKQSEKKNKDEKVIMAISKNKINEYLVRKMPDFRLPKKYCKC